MAQAPTKYQVRYKESDFRRALIVSLRKYSVDLCNIYRQKLIDGDVNATGSLITSIVPYSGELGPTEYVTGIRLETHWRWVEYGRLPGKFPPLDRIKQWIQDRNIIPYPYTTPSGRQVIPTLDQLTFLISRKIATDGIQPRPYLQESINEIQEDAYNIINDIVGDAITSISLEIGTVII